MIRPRIPAERGSREHSALAAEADVGSAAVEVALAGPALPVDAGARAALAATAALGGACVGRAYA